MIKKINNIIPELKSKSPQYVFYLIFISALEIFGIGILVGLVIKIFSINNEFSAGYFFNYISNNNFYLICFVLFLIYLIKFFFIYFLNKSLFKFCFDQQTKLRNKVVNSIFYKIKNFQYDNDIEFKKNLSLIFESCRILTENFLINFLKFFCDAFLFLVIIIFLLFYNFEITFFLLVTFLICFFIYKTLLKKRFNKIGEVKLENYKNLIELTDSIVNSLKEIIVFKQEKANLRKIDFFSKNFEIANIQFSSLSILPKLFIELGIILFFIFLVIFINFFEKMEGDSFITLLTTYAAASLRLAPLLNTIIYSFTVFWNSKKIINEFDEQFIKFPDAPMANTNLSLEPFDKLSLSKLNFNYGDKKIFNDFNIELNKSEIIGIFGKSGSGKSTLIDILLGFKKPRKFELKINNQFVSDISIVREMISYIPQNIFLYNESIKKNIVLDQIDNFSKEIYLESLKFSNCVEFVDKLKDGDEYIVGRAGEKLSVGQKQRIALARSLYHKKKILILDEPTSALDEDTEKQILENIINIKNKKISIIIISHNKDAIKICDRIYDLDKI